MKYEEYKNSDVQWIGEVPKHWGICRLKNYCSLKARIGWKGLRSEEFEEESYAYLVTGQNFGNNKIDWAKCYQINKKRYNEDPYIQLENGDLLITKDGTIGKIAIVDNLDKPACLNSGVFVLKQIKNKYDTNYLYWTLYSTLLKDFNIYTSSGTTILHLYQNVFEEMPLIIPPIIEQQAIATYLDEKCGEINRAIDVQKKKIDLLNELKQTIITDAVTKGLDPNAPMKDSGVEWIGEIPEHWKIKRTRFICKIKTGDKDTVNRIDDGQYPFYVRSPKVERIDSYSFDGEAVLMAGDGVGAGKVFHYANGKFDYHQRVYNLHNFRDVSGIYYFYYISNKFKYIIEEGAAKNTVDSVRLNMIQDFWVTIPPLPEQQIIVTHIEKETIKIDAQISKASRHIELLEELKQSIITEAVTGKIKVC